MNSAISMQVRAQRRTAWGMPVVLLALQHALLLVLGLCAPRLLPLAHPNPTFLPPGDPLNIVGARPWCRFDTAWFVGVAMHGYHWGTAEVANTNFLPLYPLLIRFFTPLCLESPWLAGVAVNCGALLIALIQFWHWTEAKWGAEVAQRATLLLLLFPFSFFLAIGYSESLFLACAISAFLYADRGQWKPAILAAACATIARPVGIAVVLGITVHALKKGDRQAALWSFSAFLPLVLFSMYLGVFFGHPLGFLVNHSEGWLPPHGSVWETISEQFHTQLSPFDRVDAVLTVLFAAGTILVLRFTGPAEAAYCGGALLLPLAHGLVGMERYVIVLFPIFALGARLPKPGFLALFTLSLLLLLPASLMFAAGFTIT